MRICLELSFKLAVARAVSRLLSTSCTAFLFLASHRRQSRATRAFVVSRAQSFGADQPDPGRPILEPRVSLDRCLELLRLHLCPLRIPRWLCQPSDRFESFPVARAHTLNSPASLSTGNTSSVALCSTAHLCGSTLHEADRQSYVWSTSCPLILRTGPHSSSASNLSLHSTTSGASQTHDCFLSHLGLPGDHITHSSSRQATLCLREEWYQKVTLSSCPL